MLAYKIQPPNRNIIPLSYYLNLIYFHISRAHKKKNRIVNELLESSFFLI